MGRDGNHVGENHGADYLSYQTKRVTLALPMQGTWLVDKRSSEWPRVVDLRDDHRFVRKAILTIREEQKDDALVIAHVEGLRPKQTMNLSTDNFVKRCGIITIEGKRQPEEMAKMFLFTERLELYHQHALYKARQSKGKDVPVHELVKVEEYGDSIGEFAEMAHEKFNKMRDRAQDHRGNVAHPPEAMRRHPPRVSRSVIKALVPEGMDSEAAALYYKPLPRNSPVLNSARIRKRNRARDR